MLIDAAYCHRLLVIENDRVIDWSEHDEHMTRPSDAGVDLSLDRTGCRPQI